MAAPYKDLKFRAENFDEYHNFGTTQRPYNWRTVFIYRNLLTLSTEFFIA